MPCTGLWFNKPPGIRPCPLYTPPVALTDGLLCEFEGLSNILYYSHEYFYIARKLKRTVWSKGKRSRNKASVGEPADGSLRIILWFLHTHMNIISWEYSYTRSIIYLYTYTRTGKVCNYIFDTHTHTKIYDHTHVSYIYIWECSIYAIFLLGNIHIMHTSQAHISYIYACVSLYLSTYFYMYVLSLFSRERERDILHIYPYLYRKYTCNTYVTSYIHTHTHIYLLMRETF